MNKLLFVISMVAFFGCDTDKDICTKFRLYNDSNHHIQLEFASFRVDGSILHNMTFQVEYGDYSETWGQCSFSGGNQPFSHDCDLKSVVYDDTYRVYLDDMRGSSTDIAFYPENWAVEKRGDIKYAVYTFTEEDYQYAVEHGTLIESGEPAEPGE